MSAGPVHRFEDSSQRRVVGIAIGRGLSAVAGWKVAAVMVAALIALLFVGFFVAAASPGDAGSGQLCSPQGGGVADIPASYVPWLERAVTRYGLGSRGFGIVAAIHKVESDFGRSTSSGVRSGTNSAGAAGPGQFLAATWQTYGVDADGDGSSNVYSIPDSVFATANYLHASGAPGNWQAAIFAYNHADWYVQEVLRAARGYGAGQVCRPVPLGQLAAVPADPVRRVNYVARWIEAQRIHYCWGGGHAAQPGPSGGSYCWSAAGRQIFGVGERGLDCSGAVRWLLVLSGYKDPGGLRSDLLGAAFPSGPGRHVTIWSNIDHVFVTIDGRDWGTGSSHFAHGPAFGSQSSAGFVASHPPGL